MQGRVAVAMSGGIDSSVCAALLRRAGRDVVGVSLRLTRPGATLAGEGGTKEGHGRTGGAETAKLVAERLGIQFEVVGAEEAFEEKVCDYFVSSYLRGETPNPCVVCNRRVKYGVLLEAARERGASVLATGHYARVSFDPRNGRYVVRKGVDLSKDQSYFLHALTQDQLAAAVFPVGDMTKKDVREIAAGLGLDATVGRESQDTCFVGSGGYRGFVRERAGRVEPGPVIDASGRVIGTHDGLPFYTIGQRRGLGVSSSEPMYVVDLDPHANVMMVAGRSALERQSVLRLRDVNYVSVEEPRGGVEVQALTRYGSEEVPAIFTAGPGATGVLEFESPREITAPGQSVVLYDGDVLLAGGIALRNAGRGGEAPRGRAVRGAREP
mgnify:CR=1 FL=1